MDIPTLTLYSSPMLVVLVMFTLQQLKVPRLVGSKCQETGGKIGKAIVTSMDKASHLRLLLVMVELLCLTMLPLLDGPLARLILELNSVECPKSTSLKTI